MESQTIIKNVKLTPKKLRILTYEIKKLTPAEALEYLTYTPKKGARILAKVIKSAVNNATVKFKADQESLVFKSIGVDAGIKLKRFNAGSRGTAKPYKKRFAHVSIVLTSVKKSAPKVKEVPAQAQLDTKVTAPHTKLKTNEKSQTKRKEVKNS